MDYLGKYITAMKGTSELLREKKNKEESNHENLNPRLGLVKDGLEIRFLHGNEDSESAFELLVDGLYNIADAGSGIWHTIPLLVQSQFREGISLLVEQPEHHLNPRIQANLVDVLITGVTGGRRGSQYIIETHSEHMINRVRTRVADGTIAPEDVAIYYCENREGGGVATELRINELGQIENWPEGFFEEEINEAMAQSRAIFQKKKAEGD